jgi:hypothetical protein
MPSVVNDIILWLSPTVAGLIVWLAHSLFRLVNEKITITNELVKIKSNISDLNSKQEIINIKLINLSSSVNDKMQVIDVSLNEIKTQAMMSDKKLTASLSRVDDIEVRIEKGTKIIKYLFDKSKK